MLIHSRMSQRYVNERDVTSLGPNQSIPDDTNSWFASDYWSKLFYFILFVTPRKHRVWNKILNVYLFCPVYKLHHINVNTETVFVHFNKSLLFTLMEMCHIWAVNPKQAVKRTTKKNKKDKDQWCKCNELSGGTTTTDPSILSFLGGRR